MSCKKSPISWKELNGAAFCAGACGTRQIRWQKVTYHYSDGTEDCVADEYVNCC